MRFVNGSPTVLRKIAGGALAGAVGTAAMSAFMFAAWRPHVMGRKPPERITERLLDRAGVPRGRTTQDALASALHVGFGMAAGSVYPLLRELLPARLPRPLEGAAFGTAIWALSYKGWVPGLGLMPPADKDRPGRQEVLVAAHWVYGGVTAALVPRLIGSRAAAAA